MQRLRQRCRRDLNMTASECAATVRSSRTSEVQRQHAVDALQAHERVWLFDAFSMTRGRCDATVDGRHYLTMLGDFSIALLGNLANRSHGRMEGSEDKIDRRIVFQA
eukprot:3405964-Prymnesium_polylepis.2